MNSFLPFLHYSQAVLNFYSPRTSRRVLPAILPCVRLILLPLLLLSASLLPHTAYAQQEQSLLAACFPHDKLAGLPPMLSRIQPAPEPVIAYLIKENQNDGIPLIPVPVKPSAVFNEALQSIVADLSPSLRKVLENSLTGIYTVRDLGSSGFTEEYSGADNRRYAFIALDADVLLNRPANLWAAWKENSAFLASPDLSLTMTLETPDKDTVVNAVRFILLHELGHVFGFVCGAHPSLARMDSDSFQAYPFVELSWQKTDGRIRSRFDAFFPERKLLRFYGAGPKVLQLAEAPALYKKVAKTNFPSLYSSLSIHEDFAESFAIYMHTIRARRPWRVEVEAPEQDKIVLESCFQDDRCRDKKAFFDGFFQNP